MGFNLAGPWGVRWEERSLDFLSPHVGGSKGLGKRRHS